MSSFETSGASTRPSSLPVRLTRPVESRRYRENALYPTTLYLTLFYRSETIACLAGIFIFGLRSSELVWRLARMRFVDVVRKRLAPSISFRRRGEQDSLFRTETDSLAEKRFDFRSTVTGEKLSKVSSRRTLEFSTVVSPESPNVRRVVGVAGATVGI